MLWGLAQLGWLSFEYFITKVKLHNTQYYDFNGFGFEPSESL